MTSTNGSEITLEEFQVIVHRAGLELTREEQGHLLPLYQQLQPQLALLHDPSLPLEGPAVSFAARWPG